MERVIYSKKGIRGLITKTKPDSSKNTENCIYQILYECGKTCIGKIKRPLKVGLKEYRTHTSRKVNRKSCNSQSRMSPSIGQKKNHQDRTSLAQKTNQTPQNIQYNKRRHPVWYQVSGRSLSETNKLKINLKCNA